MSRRYLVIITSCLSDVVMGGTAKRDELKGYPAAQHIGQYTPGLTEVLEILNCKNTAHGNMAGRFQ